MNNNKIVFIGFHKVFLYFNFFFLKLFFKFIVYWGDVTFKYYLIKKRQKLKL